MKIEIVPAPAMVPVCREVPASVLDLINQFGKAQLSLWIGESIAASMDGIVRVQSYRDGGYRYATVERGAQAQSMKEFPVIVYDTPVKFSMDIDMESVKEYSIDADGRFVTVKLVVSDTVWYDLVFVKPKK